MLVCTCCCLLFVFCIFYFALYLLLVLFVSFARCCLLFFVVVVELKKYLHGVCDAGSRLLFKFRSGTDGVNEELGRYRGREGKTECSLCGDECENVSHVLWECSTIVVIELVLFRGFKSY